VNSPTLGLTLVVKFLLQILFQDSSCPTLLLLAILVTLLCVADTQHIYIVAVPVVVNGVLESVAHD